MKISVSLQKEKSFREINIPQIVILYNQSKEKIDFDGLKEFVRGNFALRLEVRQNFPLTNPKVSLKGLSKKFSQLRIKDVNNPLAKHIPLPLEIENEQNYLKSGKSNPHLIYDAVRLLTLFESLLPKKDLDSCQIVLTDRLFGTFGDDRRFHLRSIICGYPSLISITGIIEAPAKPKEFYQIKNRLISLGLWEQEQDKVKAKFKSRFIDYGDKRITEVLKGFISQALFFYMTGNPFCENKSCRLFNSHWQEDLIYSQVRNRRFCKQHLLLMKELKKG